MDGEYFTQTYKQAQHELCKKLQEICEKKSKQKNYNKLVKKKN